MLKRPSQFANDFSEEAIAFASDKTAQRGKSALQDNFANPIAPLLFTISRMHCMSVSLSSGGAGLGTMWGKTLALDMLAAGFENTTVSELDRDIMNYY